MNSHEQASSDPRGSRASWAEAALFLSLACAQALPVLYFQYFPNWDGPAHVGAAAVLADYASPARAAFREYFVVDSFPSPNLFGHVLLVGLVPFLTGPAAERLLVVALLVLFPLSVRYAVTGVNSRSWPLAYLALPLAPNWFVHAGQYNFSFGLCFFFLTAGYWLRTRDRSSPWPTVALSVLFLLGYLCHVVALLMAFFFVIATTPPWLDAVRQEVWLNPGPSQMFWRRARRLLIAGAPALVLIAAYALRTEQGETYRRSMANLAANFLTLGSAIVAFDVKEYVVSATLSCTVLALVAYRLLALRRAGYAGRDGLLLLTVGVLALYFAVPDALAGGSFMSPRLCLFVYGTGLLWLAQFSLGPTLRLALPVLAVVLSLGLGALRAPKYAAFNRDLSEYLSAATVLRENATILPLFFTTEGTQTDRTARSLRTRPLDTAAGYLMAARGVVDLAHYESAFRYFPTHFRPEIDPFRFIGTGPDWQQEIPPHVEFLTYQTRTPGEVDYVLVWGMAVATPEVLEAPLTKSVLAQLAAGYTRVFVSPRGLMEVYARREAAIPDPQRMLDKQMNAVDGTEATTRSPEIGA